MTKACYAARYEHTDDTSGFGVLATLAGLFPERNVVGIHSVDLVWGLGTLHCSTQQEPQ